MELNNVLKAIREKTGLSQSEFAKLVDCDPSYISNIERGKVVISERRFKQLAKKAGYTTKMIIEGEGLKYEY